jgi:uncharacterized protein YukJ
MFQAGRRLNFSLREIRGGNETPRARTSLESMAGFNYWMRLMPIPDYGILKGKAINRAGGGTRQLAIHVTAARKNYRVGLTLPSQHGEVLYRVDEQFDAIELEELQGLREGFTSLDEKDDIALDYFRSGWFDVSAMQERKDLAVVAEAYVDLAISTAGATVYALGNRVGPHRGKDRDFGFSPQLGMHDLHMNQGNAAPYRAEDGIYRDGALLIHLPKRWVAIFVAFRSQAIQTDDRTGHRMAAMAAGAAR